MNTNRISFFTITALFLLAAAIIAVYANTFSSPFLFDDYHNIIGNEYMQVEELSVESLRKAAVEGPSKFRWVPKFSFALNFYFAEKIPVNYHSDSGFAGSGFVEPYPWGYHLVNLIIHIAAAISLFFLFRLTLQAPFLKNDFRYANEVALLAALAWAVHPLQTNAVTYVVQRMTSMASLFFICSLLFYVLGRLKKNYQAGKYIYFALGLVSWLLAIFSKENAAILPLIILGYEVYFLGGGLSLRSKRNIMLMAVAACAVIGIGWLYLGGNPFARVLGGYEVRDFTLSERLLTQPRVVMQYVSLLVLPLPSRLNLAYDFPVSTSLFAPLTTFFAIFCIIALIVLMFALFKRNRLWSFAIFWFLANLAIESSFIPLEIIFEHRVYLPAAFPVLALVYSLYQLSSWKRTKLVRTGLLLIIVVLMVFTWQRNQIWGSRESVWADVAAKAPNLTRGYMGLFVSYKAQNRNTEALEVLKKAVAAGPDEFRPSFNLANLYRENKQYMEALQVLNNMLQKENLRTAEVYYLLARVYVDLKNYQMAVTNAKQSLVIEPEHTNSLLIMGEAYFRLGKYAEASQYYEKFKALVPDTYGVYFNLGTVYYNLGDYDRAIANFKRALDFNPNNADIHYNLGMIYGAKGMIREMQEEFAISSRLRGQGQKK